MRKYSSASPLPLVFCKVLSLLCFNNLFLSIFTVNIFATLPFFFAVLIFFLLDFFNSSVSSVIVSSVSLSLVSSFIFSICFHVFVFFSGDSVRSMLSGVLSRLSLLSTIPSTCGIRLTFPSAIVLLIFSISSPKLICLRCSGNSVVQSVCLTATLTCCALGDYSDLGLTCYSVMQLSIVYLYYGHQYYLCRAY